MEKNVEVILATMRAEATRCIQSTKSTMTRDGRLAWYYSYIGSLEMAQQLGVITDEEREECANEFEKEVYEIAHQRPKDNLSFLKLIHDNPELPIIPLISGEIANEDSGYWEGRWSQATISKYLTTQDGDILFQDDEDVFFHLEKYLSTEEFDALPEDEAECRKIWERLPWREAIIVMIDPPGEEEQ